MLNTENWNDILTQVVVEALEKLAFMFAMREDELSDVPEGLPLTARTSFTGPFSGTLVLSFSTQVLDELTANMLGVDEDETNAEQKADAFREALNVVCGNLLPAIGGETAVFNIRMPEIIRSHKQPAGPPAARAILSIDEGWCDVKLFVEGLQDD